MNNNDFDLLQLISIALGMQNLQENRQQTAHNDVQKANDKQAEYMLKEIYRMFQEQNRMLRRILKILGD